jgi:hypothetical protein
MKHLLTFCFFVLCATAARAEDHWLILVNGERVFECPATCAANGFNPIMLRSKVKLDSFDVITIVYSKDSVEKGITKNISVSDSAQNDFKTFSVFDEDGSHAIAIKAKDFNSLHKIIIWYSETKKVKDVVMTTARVPLVYFD